MTTTLVANGINDAWVMTLKHLKELGNFSAPRGQEIIEVKNFSIKIENPKKRILTHGFRKTSLPFAFGELLWYLSADNSVKTMSYYSKRMASFSDDGKTLNSAYGYRIFGKHEMLPFNQWEFVVNKLKEDKDSRQAVIHLHTPNNKPTKDEVCTLSLQFLIRDGKLDMFTNMRSNDIVWGFTYDVFSFTSLQELMANELGVEVGSYYHNAASMHIYKKDFHLLKWVSSSGYIYEALLKTSEYSTEFSYDGLTIYDEELQKAFKVEKEFRKMGEDPESEVKQSHKQVNHKVNEFKNDALKSMIEILGLYSLHKIGCKKSKLIKKLDFNNYLHVMFANSISGVSIQDSIMLVLEGPDGAGKTTTGKMLVEAEELPFDTKVGVPDIVPDKVFDKQIYFIMATMTGKLVFDRFFYSEWIYSSHFGRERLICWDDVKLLEELMNFRKAEVKFLLLTNPEYTHKKRLSKKDRETFSVVDLESLNKSYLLMARVSNVKLKSF